MANGLTPNQEKYVQELIKSKSQRVAYKIAYPKCRASNKVVDNKASDLFKKGEVRVRFDELRNKVIKRAEYKTIITAEEIMQGIADIAKDDISNYLEYKTIKTVVDYDDDGKPIIGYRTVVDMKDSKDVNTKNISEISIARDGTLKVKTYAKDTALYKLAEIMGLNETNKAKQRLAEDKFEEEKDINGKRYF